LTIVQGIAKMAAGRLAEKAARQSNFSSPCRWRRETLAGSFA